MHLPSLKLPQPKLLAGLAIGVLVGVLGVGAVSASPAPAAAPAAATAITPEVNLQQPLGIDPGALLRAVRNNYRVEVTATGRNGTQDILYVRGVIALGQGQLTVTLPDSSTQVFTTDRTTVVRDNGETKALSDLASGERAMFFGLKNADGTYTARLIRCIRDLVPAPAAPTPSTAP